MQPETPQTETRQLPQFSPKAMWKEIKRNPFLKLAALLLAIVFWAIVIASDPTLTVEKVFHDAPVTVQGLETLRNRGYTVMEDLSASEIHVKMRVAVTQTNYERATVASFSPRLDLTQITTSGTQRVYFSAAYATYGEVVSFEPAYLDLAVEPYTQRSRIPVVIRQSGENAKSIWIDTPIADPSSLTVSGPESIVDQIRRAVVLLPLNSLSADRPHDSLSALIELQDASENPISSDLLRVTTSDSVAVDSVRIDVAVYPLREVPVSLSSAVVGTPMHGYELGEVRLTPETVFVAGAQSTLDSLSALHIQTPLNVTDAKENQLGVSALIGVSDLRYVSAGQIAVEAEIVPAIHVHTYTGKPVTVINLAPGLSAKLSRETMSVVISGEYQHVEPLKSNAIHLYVDAAGLGAGVYTPEVRCRVDGTEAYSFEAEIPRVTLTLTE